MIGSITPLVQEALVTPRWLKAAIAYTFGSVLSAATVGLALGVLGAFLQPPTWAWWSVVAVALFAVAVESGLLPRPVPLLKRQTRQAWRRRMGPTTAAFWWGVDLGNGLTTVANYRTFWVFALASFVMANPIASLILYTAYGFGRAGLVWSGPLLEARSRATGVDLAIVLGRNSERWHRVHAAIAATAVVGLIAHLFAAAG